MKSMVPHQGISVLRETYNPSPPLLSSALQPNTLQAGSSGSSAVTTDQEGSWGHAIYHFCLGRVSPLDGIETKGHTEWIWLRWQMNDESVMWPAFVTSTTQKWRSWAEVLAPLKTLLAAVVSEPGGATAEMSGSTGGYLIHSHREDVWESGNPFSFIVK